MRFGYFFAATAIFLLPACASLKTGSQISTAGVPSAYTLHDVHTELVAREGRQVLRVELTDAEQARQLAGTGGNRPTYMLFNDVLDNGTIEVSIAAELNGKSGPDARGFAGLMFHHAESDGSYEAVYLRMTNGTLNDPVPPAPRNVRAIQYIAHPDFHFPVSRERFPGKYENAAPVKTGTSHRLRLDIDGSRLSAFVDGQLVLSLDDLKFANRNGGFGLWIGDGTRAYFSDLKVIRR
ncbi:hypothetical protein DXH95_11800 [Sphingorhabdus pulchriflava]|uniref:3-keto-disaccharide hydrolase domain-containing protein n=1 Tax=Sphingorhabdus pulchriflava TaxID=2292257 RepID=A0A371B4W3_9SPHN|nr:hypothetical protein [Sphingorhabdus pulchriflava]RDV02636.1 hypothetical protein DXH95_11800 [Sphingorhabdus pulchriflava]